MNSTMHFLLPSIVYSLLFVSSLYSFNYQTVEHWRYLRQEQSIHHLPTVSSYFGYSLAIHRFSLLIGAPRDQSPDDRVVRRGAVWKCEFQSDDRCQRVPFRRDGDVSVRVGTSFDNKTDQWLGASIVANDENIIAGAPFLKHRINDGHSIEYEIPGGALIGKYGTSLSMTDSTQIYSPSFLNWHSRNYNQEGYGEFGFQMTMSTRPARIIVTAPGSFYFRGGIHSLPLLQENWVDTRHPFTSPHYPWRDSGWLRYPSNYSSNEYDDWCYRGYAVAVGNFNSDESQEIVVSVPKLHHYRGAVEIMNSNLDEYSIRTLNGTQMGEYFGASLCVVDIDNDGLDDLLVGAPLYSVRKDGRIIADAGRVDIFYQTIEHKLIRRQSIEGTREGGRLGHAMTNLGDIDKDGFNDIAITVPFPNSGSGSMVQIYRGSQNGLILTPAQVLYAPGVSGFGWAIQGLFDYDNNGYPDLAVSSVRAEKVAIILSRPVLRVETRLQHYPATMPLNCTVHNDKCFVLSLCIHLSDPSYHQSKRDTLTYELQLDKDKNSADQRLLFRESFRTIKKRHFKMSNRICHDYSLYLKDDIADKLKPIRLHINYILTSKPDPNIVPPILDPENSTFDYNIPIQKDCGPDDVCVPDLQIRISHSPKEYQVGLTKKMLIEVNVINRGENAYDAQCMVKLPIGVEYVSSNSNSKMNVYCNLLKKSDRLVICRLGNPFLANADVIIQIHVAVNNYSAIQVDQLPFTVNVTSENAESKSIVDELKIPVLSSPEIRLIGSVKPEQVAADIFEYTVGRSNTNLRYGDLEITHTYTLHNNGPSDAKRTEIKILWPMLPATGFEEDPPIMYGIDLPVISRANDPKNINDRCHIYQPISDTRNTYEYESRNEHSKLETSWSSIPNNRLNFHSNSIESLTDPISLVQCRGPMCKSFICYIDTLPIGHSVSMQLKGILRLSPFQGKLDRSKVFSVTSNVSAQVREIPVKHSSTNGALQPMIYLKLETQIPPIVERTSQHWVWLIGLSITVGVILLIVLVGVLWCCGFFKRNRPLYPVSSLVDAPSSEDHYQLATNQSSHRPLKSDVDRISSDEDEPRIQSNPVEDSPFGYIQESPMIRQPLHLNNQRTMNRAQFN